MAVKDNMSATGTICPQCGGITAHDKNCIYEGQLRKKEITPCKDCDGILYHNKGCPQMDKEILMDKPRRPSEPQLGIQSSKGFDDVNHPQHYASSLIETIDYLEDKLGAEGFAGFCIGNSLKYLSRYGKKGNKDQHIQDLKKSVWYTNHLIKKLEENKIDVGQRDRLPERQSST